MHPDIQGARGSLPAGTSESGHHGGDGDATDALQPYLPRMVRYWDQETPGRLHRHVEGTMALVDISGFTRMSERLARHGNVGAEEVRLAVTQKVVDDEAIAQATV